MTLSFFWTVPAIAFLPLPHHLFVSPQVLVDQRAELALIGSLHAKQIRSSLGRDGLECRQRHHAPQISYGWDLVYVHGHKDRALGKFFSELLEDRCNRLARPACLTGEVRDKWQARSGITSGSGINGRCEVQCGEGEKDKRVQRGKRTR